jgi:hypothetical protein
MAWIAKDVYSSVQRRLNWVDQLQSVFDLAKEWANGIEDHSLTDA